MPAFYPSVFAQRWTFTNQTFGGLAADTSNARTFATTGVVLGTDVIVAFDSAFNSALTIQLWTAKVTANDQTTLREQNPYSSTNATISGATFAFYAIRAGIIVS